MVENDGVGGDDIRKTTLILEGDSPKHQAKHQSSDEIIVRVDGNEIVCPWFSAKDACHHVDEIVEGDDNRQEGDGQ